MSDDMNDKVLDRISKANARRCKRAAEPSEADIQKTVVELLQWDGLRAIRTEHALERATAGKIRRKVGEVGMPDYLFLRYRRAELQGKFHLDIGQVAEALWIEFKASGEKPRPEQRAWHDDERFRGALVLVVDSIEGFQDWYAISGLKRR